MNIKQVINRGVALSYLKIKRESPSLIILLFHTIFYSEAEKRSNLLYPLIGMTKDSLRRIIEHFLHYGYRFANPNDIPGNLYPEQKYVLITFDDGYYNNTRMLPLLEEYDIPALFFISVGHVQSGDNFWWDVIYRSCMEAGKPDDYADTVISDMKQYTHTEVAAQLQAEYNVCLSKARSDLNRPLTPCILIIEDEDVSYLT